ncbi:hypothetical protein D1841_01240 [Neglecta sp. X4]|nr:hypothetical protein [Neglectibacter sp. 59]NBJ71987.1 hypothetical protein [Neglectibacter sp. X4]NCE79764.1 hypothetical protein [Neglectibacter sp. X58]
MWVIAARRVRALTWADAACQNRVFYKGSVQPRFYASGGSGALSLAFQLGRLGTVATGNPRPLKTPQTLLKKGLILKLILQIYWILFINSVI